MSRTDKMHINGRYVDNEFNRIDRYVDSEFKVLENKLIYQPEIRGEIAKIHRGLRDLTIKLKAEIKVKKMFGINVDFLNAEISRIDLGAIESSYWLKGNIQEERPPGATNTEVTELIDKISKLLRDFETEIHEKYKISGIISISSLSLKLIDAIKNTFMLPNNNLPFTFGLYDRNPNKPFDFNQNTPCQICGENRTIDICHVIPAELGGAKRSFNTIYLCPTHHRLFDRHMLTRDEWNELDFTQVCLASANFAKYVLKPQMEIFWNKLNNSDYQKNTVSYLTPLDLLNSYELTIFEILEQNGELYLNEIMEKTKIDRGNCIKVLSKGISENVIEKNVKKGKTIYFIK